MKTLLKTEELAEALFALVVFAHLPYAWWVLSATFLLPDLSMAGYLAGPRVGAFCYNVAHHKAVASAVGAAGWWLGLPVLQLAGPVPLFHSAFDQADGLRPQVRGQLPRHAFGPRRDRAARGQSKLAAGWTGHQLPQAWIDRAASFWLRNSSFNSTASFKAVPFS